MAAYCTLADVQAWMPGNKQISNTVPVGPPAGTHPNATQVTGWCNDVSSEVNVFLERFVALPITNVDQLAFLKLRCARELAYQCMAVDARREQKGIPALYIQWHEDWKALLEALDGGTSVLISSATGKDVPWSATRDADPEDASDTRNPVFRKMEDP